MSMGRGVGLLVFVLSAMFYMAVFGGGEAHAAPGEATNTLENQIVSYVSASCDLDPLNNCPGSYHSPLSMSFLYVPVSSASSQVSVTINGINSVNTGGLLAFTAYRLDNSNSCLPQRVGGLLENDIINNASIVINTTPSADQRIIVNENTGIRYSVFCIQVITHSSRPYPNRENVSHRLESSPGTLLGVFSGPSTSIGTGYFGGNSRLYTPSNPNWWDQVVAFSAPCSSGSSGVGGSITLYDLDTYAVVNSEMRITVTKTLKPGATRPSGTSDGRIQLSGDVTHIGNRIYDVNYAISGAIHTVNPFNENWRSEYVYSVSLENIGSANKVRIRLPYDQIFSVLGCVPIEQMTCNPIPDVTGAPGTYRQVSFTVNNETSFDWNPSSFRTEIGVVDLDKAYATANYPDTRQPPNGIGPPDHNSAIYIRDNTNGTNANWTRSNYTRNGVPSAVERYDITRNVPANGPQSFSVWVLMPATVGDSDQYGIRMLGRDGRFPGAWMNWSSSCQFNIRATNSPPVSAPDSISVICDPIDGTINAVIIVRRGGAYDPDGDTMTIDVNIGSTNSTPNIANFTNATPSNQELVRFNVNRQSTDYNVAGTLTDGINTPVNVSVSVSCPLPAAPTVNTAGTNCSVFRYNISHEEDGFSYRVNLQVREDATGSWVDVASPNNPKTGQGEGSGSYNEIAEWKDFDSDRRFRVEVTIEDFLSIGETVIARSGRNVNNCLQVQCSVNIPSIIEVNSPFVIRPSFRIVNRADGTPSNGIETRGQEVAINSINVELGTGENQLASITGSLPPGGDNVINKFETSVTSETGSFTAPSDPSSTSATITFDAANDNADYSGDCDNVEFTFSALPYVQYFRSDIIAGYGIRDAAGACTTNTTGVRGFSTPSIADPTAVVGSGTQMAIYSLGPVVGFRSAITWAGYNNSPWIRTFANTTTSDSPSGSRVASSVDSVFGNQQLGGEFDSALCADNWSHDEPASITNVSGSVDYTGVNGVVRYQNSTGPVRLYASDAVSGTRKIFVEGDVIIGEANTTDQSFAYTTNWGSTFDIPSVTIVATGNIYIHSYVTYMDGILVAGDTIFTCVPTNDSNLPNNSSRLGSAGYKPAAYEIGGECNTNSFTMQGSLVANSVKLWRTGGTNSKQFRGGAEIDSDPYQSFTRGLTQAETFRFTPELFIAPRFGEGSTNGDKGKKQLDSLISLPPIF